MIKFYISRVNIVFLFLVLLSCDSDGPGPVLLKMKTQLTGIEETALKEIVINFSKNNSVSVNSKNELQYDLFLSRETIKKMSKKSIEKVLIRFNLTIGEYRDYKKTFVNLFSSDNKKKNVVTMCYDNYSKGISFKHFGNK